MAAPGLSTPPPVPPADRGEQWQVVPVTRRGRTRYELHKGWLRRVDLESHAPITYRSLARARRVRDRLRRRDERAADRRAS